MRFSKGFLAYAFASIVLISGCAQKQETRESSIDTTAAVPDVPAAAPPADGTPAWVVELRQEEAALGRTIEEGRVGEVHDRAVKLQTLLAQIEGQAAGLTPEQQQALKGHVSTVSSLVDQMHNAGDAGDLTKAKATFQEFQTHLRSIEDVFGVPRP